MKKIIIMLLILSGAAYGSFADNAGQGNTASMTGYVVDKNTGNPVAFASVALYSHSDSSLVAGCITGEDGFFALNQLKENDYRLEVRFVGYKTLRMDSVHAGRETRLGKLYAEADVQDIDGVVVTAERPGLEFRIDKQVLQGASQITAANGTALDVLKQSPSITVDNEDNVQLRGDATFLLLINDKPVAGNYSDVLKQIPASQIESIEIMTNPSAKYSATGTSGIINVKTKKLKGEHLNGQISLKTGLGGKYDGDAIFRGGRRKFNLQIAGTISSHQNTSTGSNTLSASGSETAPVISNTVDRLRRRFNATLRPEAEYIISPRTSISAGLSWMPFTYHGFINTFYSNTGNNTVSNYKTADDFLIDADQFQADFAFSHKTDSAGPRFDVSGFALHWKGINDQDTRRYLSNSSNDVLDEVMGRRYAEDHVMKQWEVNAGLVYPLKKGFNVEAGLQSNSRNFSADKLMTLLDTANQLWYPEYLYSGINSFTESMQSAYAMGSGSAGKLQMQLGLRTQYYTRLTDIPEQNLYIDFRKLYWFPSMHLSLASENNRQWQFSVSRRINLPNDWFTSPVPYYNDGFIIQTGNPYLKPELTGVAELNHIRYIGKQMLSLSAYGRITNDAVERTLTKNSDGSYTVSHDNLAQKYFGGIEAATTLKLSEQLTLSLFADAFTFKSDVGTGADAYSYNETSFNSRAVLQYRPSKQLAAEISGTYNAAEREAAGTRAPMYGVNASMRFSLPGNKMNITLSASDIMNTMVYKYTETNNVFKSTLIYKGEYPVVFIGFTYRFNDFKPTQRPQQQSMPAMGI